MKWSHHLRTKTGPSPVLLYHLQTSSARHRTINRSTKEPVWLSTHSSPLRDVAQRLRQQRESGGGRQEVGRLGDRSWAQRPDCGGLPRPRGSVGRRAGAAPCRRRGRRDGGDHPGVPVLSLQLPAEPPPAVHHQVRMEVGVGTLPHLYIRPLSFFSFTPIVFASLANRPFSCRPNVASLQLKGTRAETPRLEAVEADGRSFHALLRRALSPPGF